MRLHQPTSGEILFEGEPLDYKGARAKKQRENVQMIFQDPYSSLNPRKTCAKIIEEPMIIHKTVTDKEERMKRVVDLMKVVGLDSQHVHRFPHEFSGGQRQRINIARALTLNPKLIVCDEPVSALDVSIQAQVLNLFGRLQREFGLTYVFISHDLSVVRHISDRIAIMYLGQVVELTAAETVYDNPLHPHLRVVVGHPADEPVRGACPHRARGRHPQPHRRFEGVSARVALPAVHGALPLRDARSARGGAGA